MPLAHPLDRTVLSDHQVYLRMQIQVFVATKADIQCHVRGRNKRVQLGQVGIQCRHCAHIWPIARRKLGSVYFPATLQGFYQAAQNMCSVHLQCGKCTELPNAVKDEFIRLLVHKKGTTSMAGSKYWAGQLAALGLVDTEHGVFLR
jgi:hypothetical protein